MRRLARVALSASMLCGLSGVIAWYARPRVSASREPDTAAAAQDTSRNEAAARDQLLRLDKQWGRAMVANDSAFFERTLSNDFLSVTGDGTFGKRELVHAVASSTAAWLSWDTYRQYVRVFGNVGVITGSLMAHRREGNRKIDEHWLYTQVCVKRGGRWQVVVGHYSRGE